LTSHLAVDPRACYPRASSRQEEQIPRSRMKQNEAERRVGASLITREFYFHCAEISFGSISKQYLSLPSLSLSACAVIDSHRDGERNWGKKRRRHELRHYVESTAVDLNSTCKLAFDKRPLATRVQIAHRAAISSPPARFLVSYKTIRSVVTGAPPKGEREEQERGRQFVATANGSASRRNLTEE
jgi:hypothetical protein